jgi:hypothetical protein
MEEKDASEMGRHILAQFRSRGVLSGWQVFHISRRKLTLLIVGFCCFISLLMGLLALYLFGNPDHHPPVPPEATHALVIIILGCVVSALLLSRIIGRATVASMRASGAPIQRRCASCSAFVQI